MGSIELDLCVRYPETLPLNSASSATAHAHLMSAELKAQGNQQLKAGNYLEALELYDRSLGLCADYSSESAAVWSNRSLCCYKMGSFTNALHDAERAMLADGSWCKPHFRRASAHLRLGQKRFARLACIAAMELARTAPVTLSRRH